MEKDECKEEDMEHCLIHTLLKGYNKNVRPVKKKSEAIQVAFDIAYSQLVDLVSKGTILGKNLDEEGGITSSIDRRFPSHAICSAFNLLGIFLLLHGTCE